jgi:hypothetical protein
MVVHILGEDDALNDRTDWVTSALKLLFDFMVAAMATTLTILVIIASVIVAGSTPTFFLLVPILHLGTAALFSSASSITFVSL